MPFFPPSGPSNNTALVSDAKYVFDGFPARFADYTQPVTVYWPWLSWDEEDVSIGDFQQAIMRCCLLGDPGIQLYGLVPDLVGSVIQLGRPEATQFWEVIHYFDWFTPESASKKLSLVWARLWVPPFVPPELALSDTCFLAPEAEIEVEYQAEIPTNGNFKWGRFILTAPGTYHFEFSVVDGDPAPVLNIFTGSCETLFGVVNNVGPGCYTFSVPFFPPSVTLYFNLSTPTGPCTVALKWGAGACPP